MPEAPEKTPLAEDRAAGGCALLVIDLLSTWDFPNADALLEQTLPIVPRIAALAARCRASGVPVVYANDNHGRWRSDFREVVAAAARDESRGAPIARQLMPDAHDYFVLKPKHSGFHATPLDLLLRHLGVQTLILTGVSGDQCVLYTAADARMHDYRVVVPRDAIAAQTARRDELAVRHFEEVMGVDTTPSDRLAVPPAG